MSDQNNGLGLYRDLLAAGLRYTYPCQSSAVRVSSGGLESGQSGHVDHHLADVSGSGVPVLFGDNPEGPGGKEHAEGFKCVFRKRLNCAEARLVPRWPFEIEHAPGSDRIEGQVLAQIVGMVQTPVLDPGTGFEYLEVFLDGLAVVEYEPNTDLRDIEQVPMQEDGGIDAFFRRKVLSYTGDAWYRPEKVKVRYEISFTRYFYQPESMRTLKETRADIVALELETQGLFEEIIGEHGP